MLGPRRASPAVDPRWPRMTDRYRLGGAGGVSPICLGAVKDPGVVVEAFDAGVNFFFVTADLHWPLYEATRRGLEMLLARGGGVRDRVVVGAASYAAQAYFSRGAFGELVAAVRGLDRIDVTIVGGAYAADFMPRLLGFPRGRGVGTTFHDRAACALAIDGGLVDIGFVRYNPGHRGAEREVFDTLGAATPALLYNFKSTDHFLREDQYAALGISPDHWRPHRTDYYRFALSRPQVDGILCALDTPSQVADLADALARGPLDDDERGYLCDLADLARGVATLSTS
jgi:hypothetical protein